MFVLMGSKGVRLPRFERASIRGLPTVAGLDRTRYPCSYEQDGPFPTV